MFRLWYKGCNLCEYSLRIFGRKSDNLILLCRRIMSEYKIFKVLQFLFSLKNRLWKPIFDVHANDTLDISRFMNCFLSTIYNLGKSLKVKN